jgi:hypothetical protein
MRVTKVLLSATIVVGLFAASANGETIKQFIAGLGVHPDHFNDFSFERILDNDDSFTISEGDVLEGVFEFESVGLEGGSIASGDRWSVGRGDNREVTGYFRLLVLDPPYLVGTIPFSIYAINLGPDGDFEAEYGEGAMVALFDDDTPDFDPTTTPVSDLFDDAKDGIHLATLGFTGAGGEATGGEGWGAAILYSLDIDDAEDAGKSAFGMYQANLTRIETTGLDNELLDLEIPESQASPYDTGDTEFALNGQLYGGVPGATLPISNTIDLFFYVTPEPSTLVGLLMGVLTLAGCACIRRKR